MEREHKYIIDLPEITGDQPKQITFLYSKDKIDILKTACQEYQCDLRVRSKGGQFYRTSEGRRYRVPAGKVQVVLVPTTKDLSNLWKRVRELEGLRSIKTVV